MRAKRFAVCGTTGDSLTDAVAAAGYNREFLPPHTTYVRVRYSETDQMAVVYHANYLVWMEVGRTEACKAAGFRYKDMEQDGILLAVAEAHCRFIGPARYDDEIAVVTTITEANRRFVTFEYELTCEGRPIATGWTKHIFLSREMRPVRLPDKYSALFGV